MTRRRWKLRTQLSLSMIFMALTVLGVFIIGMAAFYLFLQDLWLANLSAAHRTTLDALINNESVSPDALTTLIAAFSLYWGGGEYALAELAALIALIALAVLSSVVIGLLAARRLSAPIETVTRAALEIAGGNLTLEIPDSAGGVLETEDLLSGFRVMTKGLEQAEREANDSAAAIAHELRTPLTILRGRLQGLGDGVFTPSKDMTDGLIAQVDTLSRIVDELDLLSRLSAGQLVPQVIEIDLVEEVKRVITTMRPDLDRLEMKLETSFVPVFLQADPVRLRQALTALIDNAMRYAASGQYIKVVIHADDTFAYLRVVDHGPGIDPADSEKIFDRWWRADSSRNRAAGGTGLGLSVVRAIARAHGGDVIAQNNQTCTGAELALKLPLHRAGGVAEQAEI
ncbi:sensor histidine kinase [Ruegeria meonggei]|uniref:histidine kinase n=1 Tax=Ruegeria meonggei TaxID=1446476 RepID=A0A1X6ZXQ4_9RHOB|nr:ATP-binding protein [Ruegeria meonggei]SLN64086.1 Signal transduction histidine-protein kinase BaeS [Ruegeria meonggei]